MFHQCNVGGMMKEQDPAGLEMTKNASIQMGA